MLPISFAKQLAESANHLSVDSFGFHPNRLDSTLDFDDWLLALRCLSTQTLIRGLLDDDLLREICELLLDSFHLLDIQHVFFDQRFLSVTHLLHQSYLPILYVTLLVHSHHELLLHGEVGDVLLLESLYEQSDSLLTVLRFN